MKHTEHYQLNQWEANDKVQRTDFNADNAKIDAALGQMPKVACGSYRGNGAASRVIPLNFTPRMVFVCSSVGHIYTSSTNGGRYSGGLAVAGAPVIGDGQTVLAVVEGGFQVSYAFKEYTYYVLSNAENTTYHYFAIG